MDAKEDWYAILRVHPNAEDCVIRAACEALVDHYDPKSWTGDRAFARQQMAAFNRAYEVLRNPERRKAFDASRVK